MERRRPRIALPIWARVPGTIALVLVGVLGGTLLLGAADIEGRSDEDHVPPGHDPSQDTPVENEQRENAPEDDTPVENQTPENVLENEGDHDPSEFDH